MEIRKILWPTDLSDESVKALPYVDALSRQMNAQVVVLYVPEDLTRFPDYVYGGPSLELVKQMTDWEMKTARERMESTCRDKLSGCPGYAIRIIPGVPVAEILNAVDSLDIDLVVMAPHGRGSSEGETAFDIGSTTERVVRRSPVPVLVVSQRTRGPERAMKEREYAAQGASEGGSVATCREPT